MNIPRTLLFCAALAAAPAFAAPADPSGASLALLDKTTASARMELSVTVHAAAPAGGKAAAGRETLTYPVHLLFERPYRFRLVLDPGGKGELRAAGDGEQVRWYAPGSGLSGKEAAADVLDPLARALLATAGELDRLAKASELPRAKDSPLQAVRLHPQTYGSGVRSATAWLHAGWPTGLAFELADGRRVFVAVLGFEHNPELKPSDFEL